MCLFKKVMLLVLSSSAAVLSTLLANWLQRIRQYYWLVPHWTLLFSHNLGIMLLLLLLLAGQLACKAPD
jgi:hypothetical protein